MLPRHDGGGLNTIEELPTRDPSRFEQTAIVELFHARYAREVRAFVEKLTPVFKGR